VSIIRRKDAPRGPSGASYAHSLGELRAASVCVTTYLRNLLHLHRPSRVHMYIYVYIYMIHIYIYIYIYMHTCIRASSLHVTSNAPTRHSIDRSRYLDTRTDSRILYRIFPSFARPPSFAPSPLLLFLLWPAGGRLEEERLSRRWHSRSGHRARGCETILRRRVDLVSPICCHVGYRHHIRRHHILAGRVA
jgi:hypothetical protein